MSLNDFVIDTIGNVIRAGGETVDQKEYERRVAICNLCAHKGKVSPVPLVSAEGCKLCSCPLRTKARTKTHFSKDEFKIIETTCPHPEGDKWATN